MASRKAAFDDAVGNEDERPNKRPRLEEDAGTDTRPSLESLNADCLLHILTFLPSEDLNSIAICGRRYQKARAHESLDQTRTGTIVISQQHTIASLFNLIATNGWVESFQGNRTHLKIIGLERLGRGEASTDDLIQQGVACRFSGVTSLELAGNFSETRFYCLWPLSYAFQNLEEVDVSSLTGNGRAWLLCHYFCMRCLNLRRFVWKGYEGDGSFNLDGCKKLRGRNLTDIVMDDSHFARGEWWDRIFFISDSYMFERFTNLQRLSIKNATYQNCHGEKDLVAKPVSQDMLIKMVRRHPTLQWLRSDLTEENIAMLKLERPDITFVRD